MRAVVGPGKMSMRVGVERNDELHYGHGRGFKRKRSKPDFYTQASTSNQGPEVAG